MDAQRRVETVGHLLGGVLHRDLVVLGVLVPRGIHPLQVGQGLLPDPLAGLGVAAADGMVAGGGGSRFGGVGGISGLGGGKQRNQAEKGRTGGKDRQHSRTQGGASGCGFHGGYLRGTALQFAGCAAKIDKYPVLLSAQAGGACPPYYPYAPRARIMPVP